METDPGESLSRGGPLARVVIKQRPGARSVRGPGPTRQSYRHDIEPAGVWECIVDVADDDVGTGGNVGPGL